MAKVREQNLLNISVTVLTKNSEKYLKEVLDSLKDFDEVLIIDSGSSDNTLQIASDYPNTRCHVTDFPGFGPQHNRAVDMAKHDWILSIDSDEVVTSELVQEFKSETLEEGTVYSFPRKNFYNGRWIRWCGWHPDVQYRLFHRRKTRFTDAQVHEAVMTAGMKIRQLSSPIVHYSYASTAEFLQKMQHYSDLFAKDFQGKRKSSLFKAISHGFFAFFKSYILKRGFLGGAEGFIISVYNGNTAFYKYLKLMEKNGSN